MTTTNDTYIKRLMYAVHHWLSYTANVSRCALLAESSLRYPICEYIERHTNDNCKCEIEVPFSILSDKRRKIDIVWSDGNSLNCMELKFVSEHTSDRSEKQRIFNDLCRLFIASQTQTTTLLESPENRHCYFVICGDSNLFISKFQQCEETPPTKFDANILQQTNDKTIAKGDVSNWFSFKEGGIKEVANVTYTIKHSPQKGGDTKTSYYNQFWDNYKDIVIDEEFKKLIEQDIPHFYTKLIGYINTSTDNTQTSQSIAIWEILCKELINENEYIMDTNGIIRHLQKINEDLENIKERNNDLMQRIKDNNDNVKD